MASLSHPKARPPLEVAALLRRVKRLQTNRQFRDSQCQFFIEGIRNFIQAIDRQLAIATILYSEKLFTVPLSANGCAKPAAWVCQRSA